MDGCLYMTPPIIFDFLGLTIAIKVVIKVVHSLYRYLGHYDIFMIDDWQCKKRVPPAVVSVGVNSYE